MSENYVNPTPAYLCDPNKNESCKRGSCFINNGPCFMTLHEENAIDGAGIFRYIDMGHMKKVEKDENKPGSN